MIYFIILVGFWIFLGILKASYNETERKKQADIVLPRPAPPVERSAFDSAVSRMQPESVKLHRSETVEHLPDGRIIAQKQETIIIEGRQQPVDLKGLHFYFGPGGGSGPASYYQNQPPEFWEAMKKRQERLKDRKGSLWNWMADQ